MPHRTELPQRSSSPLFQGFISLGTIACFTCCREIVGVICSTTAQWLYMIAISAMNNAWLKVVPNHVTTSPRMSRSRRSP